MRWSKTTSSNGSPGPMGDEAGNTISWAELLVDTETRLATLNEVHDPRAEARWMVEEATGATGPELVDALREPATVRGVAHLDSMVERRAGGEPIQYVLGHWSFRRLDLMVDRRVLIPRPETEVLVEYALIELDRQRSDGLGTVVDLGTGSGAIGLSIAAERPGTRVLLSDADEDALAVARANLAGLGIIGGTVEIVHGSWYRALPPHLVGECDVVVANPPYVPEAAELPASVEEWEPIAALRAGADGMDDLRELVDGVRQWLRSSGAIVLEMDPEQTAPIAQRLEAAELETEIHADMTGRARVVVGRVGR